MWLALPSPTSNYTMITAKRNVTVKLHSGRRDEPDRNSLRWVAKYQFVSNSTFPIKKNHTHYSFLVERGHAYRHMHTHIRTFTHTPTHWYLWGTPASKNKGRGRQPEARAVQLWPFKKKNISKKGVRDRGLIPSFPHTSWSLGWDILIAAWMTASGSRHCVHV